MTLKDDLAAPAFRRDIVPAMTHIRLLTATMVVGLAGPAAAAPLVLYDPATPTATTPDLKSGTTLPLGSANCGWSSPCTDLNTATQASLAAPLAGNYEYGMSGVATAGVSNHGQGGSLGVLGWVKMGDTTLSLGVSVGETRFNRPKYIYLPPPAP
jgi:hypothetical protein